MFGLGFRVWFQFGKSSRSAQDSWIRESESAVHVAIRLFGSITAVKIASDPSSEEVILILGRTLRIILVEYTERYGRSNPWLDMMMPRRSPLLMCTFLAAHHTGHLPPLPQSLREHHRHTLRQPRLVGRARGQGKHDMDHWGVCRAHRQCRRAARLIPGDFPRGDQLGKGVLGAEGLRVKTFLSDRHNVHSAASLCSFSLPAAWLHL